MSFHIEKKTNESDSSLACTEDRGREREGQVHSILGTILSLYLSLTVGILNLIFLEMNCLEMANKGWQNQKKTKRFTYTC